MDLALNNLKSLICHKIQTNNEINYKMGNFFKGLST